MLTLGMPDVVLWDDGWTIATLDGQPVGAVRAHRPRHRRRRRGAHRRRRRRPSPTRSSEAPRRDRRLRRLRQRRAPRRATCRSSWPSRPPARTGRLRVDRPVRADAVGVLRRAPRVRPPRARRRGRRQGPPAARSSRCTATTSSSCSRRRGTSTCSRPSSSPRSSCSSATATSCRCATGKGSALAEVRKQLEDDPEQLAHGPMAVLHAVDGPRRRRLRAGDRRPRQRHPRDRGRGLRRRPRRPRRPDPAHLQAQARGARLPPPHQAAVRGARPAAEPALVPHCPAPLREYFRDVQDHLLRVVAEIENFRDLLSDALNANLAQVSVRQNDDMRKISALRRHRRRADGRRRHLRHELRPHARARWGFGYPLVMAVTAVDLPAAVPPLQEGRLAVASGGQASTTSRRRGRRRTGRRRRRRRSRRRRCRRGS